MRPEDKLEKTFRLKEVHKKAFKKMGVVTVLDLLYYFPARYNHIAEIKNISDLSASDTTTIYGKIISTKITKAYLKNIPIGEATIEDKTGKIRTTWFNQAYVAKILKKGDLVKLSGVVSKDKNGTLYMANPEFEKTSDLPIDVGDSLFTKDGDTKQDSFSFPVYPERRGVTSRWIYQAVQRILNSGVLDKINDNIPEKILTKYNLPKLKTALIWIHTPKKSTDAEIARKRFAFEEIFYIQLKRQLEREKYKDNKTFLIKKDTAVVEDFLNRFPFTATRAQNTAIDTILSDMEKDEPMTRLLEGDVGSGKTLVAATTARAVISTRPNGQSFGNLQVAYMAPTEILANQHFDSFIEYFGHLPINIGLITGSGCKKFPSKVDPTGATKISRAQLLKWVENGEIAILIGTHSLIQKTVKFKDLAYVIIDEQHRFGIMQRGELLRKDTESKQTAPHLLSMTATPIPRTLALTIYGDLDLTLLDEMPKGRKEIITKAVMPAEREEVYEKIKEQLSKGRQAYVICPRINEPDPNKATSLRVKSVEAEAERLRKNIFKDKIIEVLHGKMRPHEKEEIMERFLSDDIDILVATSVVEVGVNVPNATSIIIEGAERFGLSQLHQLRGRVLRSNHQAYCYLFASDNTSSKQTGNRLSALVKAKNGFELSEIDLQLRGSGELSGTSQHGVSDIGMDAIKNIKMVEAARTEAKKIAHSDAQLKNYPQLSSRLNKIIKDVHFE